MISQNPNKRSVQWRIHLGLLPSSQSDSSIETVIEEQRQCYRLLVENHPYPKLDDDDKVEDCDGYQEQSTECDQISKNKSKKHETDLDPLTAIAIQEQEEKDRLHEMDLEFRKQRAIHKRQQKGRGVAGGQPRRFIEDESEEFDQRVVTLQIIEKDLNRLPVNDDETDNPDKRSWRKRILTRVLYTWSSVYPTSGYLQGMHEIAFFVLYAIEKEYHSIIKSTIPINSITRNTDPLPIETTLRQMPDDGPSILQVRSETSEEELLVDVSLIDSVEVASQLFDTFDENDPTLFAICADTYIITDWIIRSGLQSSYDLSLSHRVDKCCSNISNETGSENIKQQTTVCYNRSAIATSAKPLVSMAHRVMASIGFQDHQLGQLLTSHSIPITLLLTKWVRVLFTREVLIFSSIPATNVGIGITKNSMNDTPPNPDIILNLWDVLFQTVYEKNQRQPSRTSQNSIDDCTSQQDDKFMLHGVLEAFAAARFVLHSHTIRYYLSSYDSTTDCLHWLMNIPPENPDNVQCWIQVMKFVLNNVRISSTDLYRSLPRPPISTAAYNEHDHGVQQMYNQEVYHDGNVHRSNNQAVSKSCQENSAGFLGTSFSLLSIKDKLTNQTHSIQKRLQQEWEAFQHQQKQQQLHSQPIFVNSDGLVVVDDSNQYNLDYHRPAFQDFKVPDEHNANISPAKNALHAYSHDESQQDIMISSGTYSMNLPQQQKQEALHNTGTVAILPIQTTATKPENPSFLRSDQARQWSERIEIYTATLQHYMITIEQNRQLPSTQISTELYQLKNRAWEALADLQVLSNEMKKT